MKDTQAENMTNIEIHKTGTHKVLDEKDIKIQDLTDKLVLARRMLREKLTEDQLAQVLKDTDPDATSTT